MRKAELCNENKNAVMTITFYKSPGLFIHLTHRVRLPITFTRIIKSYAIYRRDSMNKTIRYCDTHTVSELRLWADRARQNHACIQNESESAMISDSAVLVLYSLIKISRLTESLSDEFKATLPLTPWDKLRKHEAFLIFSDNKIIRYISSIYINELNILDCYLEEIIPSKFN